LKQDAAVGKRSRDLREPKPANARHFGHARHIDSHVAPRKRLYAGIVDGSFPSAEKDGDRE
jgi:hypothetical protein